MQDIPRVLGLLITFELLALALAQPMAAMEPTCLKHDDGSPDDRRSMAGSGHAVRFECPDADNWHVTAISVYGSRYGTPKAPRENFQVIIANEDLTKRQEIQKPYSLFQRGQGDWVRFNIDPVQVQGPFYVSVFFNPTSTKGVYVGIDSNSSPTHSAIIRASDPGQKQSDLPGDWMIRAYVTKRPTGVGSTLDDDATRGEQQRKAEAERDAAVLGEARSLTLKHDTQTADNHMNIQGALYTVSFETPKNVQAYVWQVQIFASQFGAKHDSQSVSGDIYILNEDRQIVSRTTFPYSLATQQKQWISIPTLPTKVQGKFFVSIDAHGTQHKGLYMGYSDGNESRLASTDELDDNHVQTADWSKKYERMQWQIRVKVADRPVVY